MKPEMNEPASFDEAFRTWAEQPPATSATDATRAVVARLQAGGGLASPEPRGEGGRREAVGGLGKLRVSPGWATLVAAILVVVAGTASFIRSLPARSDAPGPRASARGPLVPVPARDADVVLWLDDGTPVYVYLPGKD